MNLSLETYIQAAKNIAFKGDMQAKQHDIILIPYTVTQTSCGKSTRLTPTKNFPSVLLDQQTSQMSYLKPNILYNAQTTFPSIIMKMFYFMEPFNESIIRQELQSLGHENDSIDVFLSLFEFLQKQNLEGSKLAQAAVYVLQMKFSSTLFEQRFQEIFETMKKRKSTDMDIYFSDLVTKNSMEIQQEIKQLIQDIKPIVIEEDTIIDNYLKL